MLWAGMKLIQHCTNQGVLSDGNWFTTVDMCLCGRRNLVFNPVTLGYRLLEAMAQRLNFSPVAVQPVTAEARSRIPVQWDWKKIPSEPLFSYLQNKDKSNFCFTALLLQRLRKNIWRNTVNCRLLKWLLIIFMIIGIICFQRSGCSMPVTHFLCPLRKAGIKKQETVKWYQQFCR